jgi:hypothetical protein
MQTHKVSLVTQEKCRRKYTLCRLLTLGAYFVFALGFAGCTSKPSDQATSTRPACVTLPMYSSVIDQVMKVQPSWDPLRKTDGGFQTEWVIQNPGGRHMLTAMLTSERCICAANATSQYRASYDQGKLAGLVQGAAVAPVSDLDYTKSWLEPRILLPCTLAFVFHRSYEAETTMPDGTTWKLICTRSISPEAEESFISFTVSTPNCAGLLP